MKNSSNFVRDLSCIYYICVCVCVYIYIYIYVYTHIYVNFIVNVTVGSEKKQEALLFLPPLLAYVFSAHVVSIVLLLFINSLFYHLYNYTILGSVIFCTVFQAHSQNCVIRLFASPYLSVRMEQLGCQWADFRGILYSDIFRKSVERTEVPLKSVKNNGYCT